MLYLFQQQIRSVSTEFLFKRYFKIGGVINYENKNKERDEFTTVYSMGCG